MLRTTISVNVQEKFGLEKIEVRDDGCGIKESDTEFMAQKYYTSKILKHEDLQTLETYGFRGEALGSLCQVADVCIITRTAEDPVAVLYHLDRNGKVYSAKPTHDGVGTTVITSNLFKNVPVRKQCFQTNKKCKEELKKIEDLLMAYGLINPDVRIILRNNKNVIWQKNKSSDIRTALTDVFGIQVVNQFDYFEYCDSDLHLALQCFVPKTDSDPRLMWRSSDDRSFIFVNKRYIIWKELSQVPNNCVNNVFFVSKRTPLFIKNC
jgi:DNA mismatch repair protein PMS1